MHQLTFGLQLKSIEHDYIRILKVSVQAMGIKTQAQLGRHDIVNTRIEYCSPRVTGNVDLSLCDQHLYEEFSRV